MLIAILLFQVITVFDAQTSTKPNSRAIQRSAPTISPEWLVDLRAVYVAGCDEECPLSTKDFGTSLDMAEIRRFAQSFPTATAFDAALQVLPTPERRDRARKTLISYTSWQPQPGHTAHGH